MKHKTQSISEVIPSATPTKTCTQSSEVANTTPIELNFPTIEQASKRSLLDIVSSEPVSIFIIRKANGEGYVKTQILNYLTKLFAFAEPEKARSDSEIQRKIGQVDEVSNLVIDNYGYLSFEEFLYFINQVKAGRYGQVSWGSYGINPQQLMSLLHEFESDRALAFEKYEKIRYETDKAALEAAREKLRNADKYQSWKLAAQDFDVFRVVFRQITNRTEQVKWFEKLKENPAKIGSYLTKYLLTRK